MENFQSRGESEKLWNVIVKLRRISHNSLHCLTVTLAQLLNVRWLLN